MLSFLKDINCQKKKVQWLDLTSHLWRTLIGLPLLRTIGIHYEIIVKYSKPLIFFFTELFLVHVIYEK